MSRRWKILIAAGAVVMAGMLISAVHHYRLRAATEAYIAKLKANGEPMELAQVMPPPVPPEQNGTETFRKAAALLDADKTFLETNSIHAMDMAAPGKAVICSQQPVVLQTYSTNSWEALTAAVGQNKEALNLLHQIIEHPALDFGIHYERGFGEGFEFTNLNLVQLRNSANYLSANAICNLHHGDVAAAVKNEQAMLALANAMQSQRLVISELVRMAITRKAVNLNWEILQSPGVTGEQLTALQNDWDRLNFLQGCKDALIMERLCGENTLSMWRNSDYGLNNFFGWERRARENIGFPVEEESWLKKAKSESQIFLWRYWWSYPDELRCLRGHEVLMETLRYAETNGAFLKAFQQQQARLDALGINKLESEFGGMLSGKTDFHSMLSESITTLGYTFKKVMTVESAKRIVVTAIALKRFQLKHGNYPEKLSDLTPEFLPSVPLDPVDGQPLRYRRNVGGTFLLYSVGENGKDNGGNPSLEKDDETKSFQWQNPHALDWVWPQPATPEEIQKYYDEQARKPK